MENNLYDKSQEEWDDIIGPKNNNLSINFGEVWRYRDLLVLFVKRDIVTVYKQTILGPVWFLLQPVFTTLIYKFIFLSVAKIDIGKTPPLLFFMGSVTLWNYFSDTLNTTSKTFSDNASVFGKVYFPRLILPLSKALSGLIKLFIQFGLFFIVWFYYLLIAKTISPNWEMVYFPIFILLLATISLGIGIIITALTTKYRDLIFLISFGVQLLMYATPVIYPVSLMSPQKQFWLWLNPLTSIFEGFKYAFLGSGVLNYFWLAYSTCFAIVLFVIGIIVFNRIERKFIDTV